MKAFVFPGQMSEHAGMWPLVVQRVPAAETFLHQAEEAAGFPLLAPCRNAAAGGKPLEDLTAQVAIMAVCAAYTHQLTLDGARPGAMAGHSLGYYMALVAADVLEFTDAVELVVYVQKTADALLEYFDGAMGVVIGNSAESVGKVCREAGSVEVANINTSRQVVVSGEKNAVDRVLEALEPGAMKVQRLKTGIPFHSRWMEPVSRRLLSDVDPGKFRHPRGRLFSHLDGARIGSGRDARDLLCTQLSRPVDWRRTVLRMVRAGCDLFVEVGPGDILSRMIRWIERDVSVRSVETDFEQILEEEKT